MTFWPLCVPRALPHTPTRCRLLRLAWLTVTVHEPAAAPLFCTRTEATYPWSQLALTLTVAVKWARGAGEDEADGEEDREREREGDGEWLLAAGRADERDGDAEGDAEA